MTDTFPALAGLQDMLAPQELCCARDAHLHMPSPSLDASAQEACEAVWKDITRLTGCGTEPAQE